MEDLSSKGVQKRQKEQTPCWEFFDSGEILQLKWQQIEGNFTYIPDYGVPRIGIFIKELISPIIAMALL